MNLYLLFFATGAAGMIAMAILGVAGGHGGGRAHSSHGARAHGGAPHSHAGHAHATHAVTHIASAGRGAAGARIAGAKVGGARANGARGSRGGRATSSARGSFKDALSAWLSPRVLFTLSLGAGATGLLLEPHLSNAPLLATLAIAGGLFLEKALVAPLWGLLMQFGSSPARTLESAAFEEAVALTAFDSQGCGLVSITLDGHEMRALARLKPNENGAQPRVKLGDILLVESVDAKRNQCVVSILGE